MSDTTSSSARAAARAAFVEAAGWPASAIAPLAADASTRSYYRLVDGARRAVLMDAPPGAEEAPCPPDATPEDRMALGYNAVARLAGPDARAFAAMAAWLRTHGLSAPDIYEADFDRGFMLIEDLGDALFARIIEQGEDARALYEAAIDVQVALHGVRAPQAMAARDGSQRALLDYDATALRAEVDVFLDWYPRAVYSTPPDTATRARLHEAWDTALGALSNHPPVVTLRDYHAENLIWLGEREGPARVGLLDFQDALRGAPAYDLASLLTDARRDVEPALADAMKARYLAERVRRDPTFDTHAFLTDYAILAVQRNVKILGIFARLCLRDGKPRYLAFMPRIWRYLEADLTHPALQTVHAWFADHVPAEARGDAAGRRHAQPGR